MSDSVNENVEGLRELEKSGVIMTDADKIAEDIMQGNSFDPNEKRDLAFEEDEDQNETPVNEGSKVTAPPEDEFKGKEIRDDAGTVFDPEIHRFKAGKPLKKNGLFIEKKSRGPKTGTTKNENSNRETAGTEHISSGGSADPSYVMAREIAESINFSLGAIGPHWQFLKLQVGPEDKPQVYDEQERFTMLLAEDIPTDKAGNMPSWVKWALFSTSFVGVRLKMEESRAQMKSSASAVGGFFKKIGLWFEHRKLNKEEKIRKKLEAQKKAQEAAENN